MATQSPKVDAYIAKSAEFAKPILEKIRKAFHKAHPQIEETIKWGFPHFEHKGVLGSMAAFKNHVSWGFWKGSLMNDPEGIINVVGDTTMGHNKVTKASELPSEKVIVAYVREAIRLNEEGVKVPRAPRSKVVEAEVPADLAAALKKSPAARKTFENFPPSQKNEYVTWITEAKQEATRKRRLAQAIEWMSEGKYRNWKYMESRAKGS